MCHTADRKRALIRNKQFFDVFFVEYRVLAFIELLIAAHEPNGKMLSVLYDCLSSLRSLGENVKVQLL